ncbi:MAG: RNA polymerase sigma factor [Actinomycetota bacterium]
MSPTGAFSDRDLVIEFQAGCPDAYDEMYRRHQARVMRVCYRMLGNTADAEEAAQETFLKAYQALPRFNGQYQLGAWLTRIAANVCVDHLRVKSRTHLVALPDGNGIEGTESGPEELVVGDHPRLEAAIQEVQPLHARALTLRAVEGLSHREIAGALRMSPDQVKALLHRARTSLRKAWDRAEGWALAPVLAFRSTFGRSESAHTTPNLATVAPQFPYFVERVAASAVIVVVALTGLPSSPVDDAPGPRRVAAPIPSETPRAPSPVLRGTIEGATAITEAEESQVTDVVIATIEATVKGRDELPNDPDPPGPTDDPNDRLGKAHAAATATVAAVKDKVVTTIDQLTRPE